MIGMKKTVLKKGETFHVSISMLMAALRGMQRWDLYFFINTCD
jgi:hypothetical protein